ncbi:MAG: class I SAM-dependent methyltransferase, partial [Candidatus Kariarchaeaceae archaeon]
MMNTKCYLCGSICIRKIASGVRDNPDIDVMKCRECGLVFLSSFDHISDDYYANLTDVFEFPFESNDDDIRRIKMYTKMLKGRSLLDFGAGNCRFMVDANHLTSRCDGVELNEEVHSHFKEGTASHLYRNMNEVRDRYDVITMFHVIEHLKDPRLVLQSMGLSSLSIRDCTSFAYGGDIIVETPNANDALLNLYHSDSFAAHTYWSNHLMLFSPATLRRLAEQAGLKVRYIQQVQRYSLFNHLYWLSHGKPNGHNIWKFLDTPEINNLYAKQLALLGECDTIVG